MICDRLRSATKCVKEFSPRPAALEIVRAVCQACDRLDTCPCLTLDFAANLGNSQTTSFKSRERAETRGFPDSNYPQTNK